MEYEVVKLYNQIQNHNVIIWK